jgi:ferritin-like metal-binding protein YciE
LRPGPALRSPHSRSEALDAGLIAAQQAVEHDEITRMAP